MKKETRRIELVETGNIACSLRRIYRCPGPTTRKTKRALFNAVQMTEILNDHELATLRVALQLP